MKKLLLTLALLTGSTFISSAITPQDLDGKTVCQVYWGNDFQPGPVLSTVGKFSLEGEQLYLRYFRGRFKIPVTISNNTLIFPLQQTFYGEDPNNETFKTGRLFATNGLQYSDDDGNVITQVNGYAAACYQKYTNYNSVQTSAYSNNAYNYISLPNFYIQKSASLAFELNGSDSNFAIYKKMGFFILDNTNAQAHDSNGLNYDMRVNLLDNNVISLPNLYNKGLCYQYNRVSQYNYNYSFKWITGDYQYTADNKKGTINIKPQYTGGLYKCGYYGYRTWYQTIYTTNKWTGYWYSTEGTAMLHQRIASDLTETTEENQFWPIHGSFEVKNVYHESPENAWAHHDDGDLHTYEDWDITIDNSIFYNQAATTVSGRYGVENEIEWTKIAADKLDVTHHATVTMNHSGYGETGNGKGNYIYVSGTVNREKHSHNVTGYEIYLVPGTHTSPSGADFNHENGHVKAINITDYITDFVPNTGGSKAAALAEASAPTAEELNAGDNFNLLVPESAFGNDANTSGKYTLFVKALYNDNVNKAAQHNDNGTFHALTQLTQTITGVTDMIYNAENSSITVADGAIVIEGSEGKALVSTTAGVVVYQGGDNTVNVAPGMYIVRANNTVKRVLVK